MGAFAFLFFCLHRFALRDLTDEAIASAMGSFNKPWRLWIVAENFSQLANGNFEDTFSNESSRPNRVEKFLFCDELARMPKQVIQHCKGFGSELYRPLALPQAFVSQVQAKGVEDDAFFVRHYAPTLQKFYGRIMTLKPMQEYSPFLMEGWQYKAAFVIQFRPETNVESKRFEGSVEHVASSKAMLHQSGVNELTKADINREDVVKKKAPHLGRFSNSFSRFCEKLTSVVALLDQCL